MIQRCAKAFRAALHLQPGDVVGLVLPNIPEFVIVLNGALEAGLTVTFANPLYTEGKFLFINKGQKLILRLRTKGLRTKSSLCLTLTCVLNNFSQVSPDFQKIPELVLQLHDSSILFVM